MNRDSLFQKLEELGEELVDISSKVADAAEETDNLRALSNEIDTDIDDLISNIEQNNEETFSREDIVYHLKEINQKIW